MKNKIIWVGRDGRPSMKLVYSKMLDKNVQLQVRRNPKKGKQYIRLYTNNVVAQCARLPIEQLNLENAVVIRWGNRIEGPTNDKTIMYNKIKAIEKATNKKLSREIFLKKGVNTPKLFTPQSKDITYPIIARPLAHSKGKNFVTLNNLDEFTKHYKEGWYYSEFIDKDREFRVHCAHGKILAIMEKPRVEGQIAWNRAINHQAFNRVKQENYLQTVCYQALKAIKSLDLDFGGVDIVVKTVKGAPEAFVLEVNTSPTLNSTKFVSEQYAKYFTWLFKKETRQPHWDFTKWKDPKSFAWKQNQF